MTKKTLVLTGFVVVKFLLQYSLISPDYDLQRDEYLHLDQAHHLAWGYQSVPPVTSWISFLIYALGNSVFWIKFFPALFGALTIVVVWKAIEELNGNLYALVLGATGVLFSALLRINTLYQPNSLDVLCWTTLYYILIKWIRSEDAKWLYLGAVLLAIGFLNKYNIVFLLIGLLPAVLLTGQRRILTHRNFYFAMVLGLLLVLPNLLWQYHHHFPVVHHLKELADTQLVNVERADFLKSQILFYLGAFPVLCAAFYALYFYPPFRPYRVFLWSFLFTLAAFLYFKAKDYYAIGVYPVYIAFGSVFLAEQFRSGWRKYLKPVVLAIPILVFISLYFIAFPNHSPEYIIQHSKLHKELGLLRWEDGKDHPLPQDFADMLGWKELAIKVDSVLNTLPHPDHTFLLCDNYGEAGAINYYSKNKKIKANSFSADYVNWINLDQKITDGVLVMEEEENEKNSNEAFQLFDTVYLAGKRINPYAREQAISIYVLLGAKVDVNARIREEIRSKE